MLLCFNEGVLHYVLFDFSTLYVMITVNEIMFILQRINGE